MAGSFQPRFVDLVRNYSTTTGTGNLVLGNAVAGFTGFADALQPGDQFYYSAAGLEKTGETEVGRGTLQADGSIARDPSSGVLTNFSAGMKSVSLVAAAEWFSSSAAEFAGKVQHVASRIELANAPVEAPAAFLRESGREGTFVWDGADHSAHITADPGQGIYVPAASDATGASGAWVRKFSGSANARWWGAKGDGTANDFAAIDAALSFLAATKLAGGKVSQYGSGASIPLYFPSGNYYCGGNTITVSTYGAHIHGDGTGEPGGAGTQFTFDNNTSGFLFSGSGASTGSAGWMLERCSVVGGWAGGDEGEFHGIQWNWPGTIRDVQVYNFPGDALVQNNALYATSTGSSTTLIDRMFIGGCRIGFYDWGNDSNACEIRGLCVQGNRQAGVLTGSGLGNSFYGCLGEANGTLNWNTGASGRPCSCVYYEGHIYTPVLGQEAWCSTHAPSGSTSSNQGWIYCWDAAGAGTGYPAWFSGISARPGGHYLQHGDSDQTSFFGCYAEGDAWNQIDQKALIVGPQGQLGSFVSFVNGYELDQNRTVTSGGTVNSSGPAVIDNYGGVRIRSTLCALGPLNAQSANNVFGPTAGAPSDATSYLETTNYHHFLQARSWNGGSPSNIAMIDFAANGGLIYDAQIANWAAHSFKVQGAGIAQINSGGLTLLSGALGYATGAGGAVTQATSKSTSVTLNAATGRITMSNTALAGSTSASFTLINSSIAATDIVVVNVASGATANSYAALVDAVNAGSCRISLRNVSAASLSEAVVLNFALIKGANA